MSKEESVGNALNHFAYYAGLDHPRLPGTPICDLQVLLARWQNRNFGPPNEFELLAGATEELGELAHALLKGKQEIRGFDDPHKVRVEAGDAIADTVIYLIQLCTLLRLDFGELLFETASDVLRRDWKTNPDGEV